MSKADFIQGLIARGLLKLSDHDPVTFMEEHLHVPVYEADLALYTDKLLIRKCSSLYPGFDNLRDYAAGPSLCARMLSTWILENPSEVAGKHLVDLGAGSGVVAIAAAKAGAARATAVEVANVELIALNAAVNNVAGTLEIWEDTMYGAVSRRLIEEAAIVAICSPFGRENKEFQSFLSDQRAKGKTFLIATNPWADMDVGFLTKHGEPIAPRWLAEQQPDLGGATMVRISQAEPPPRP